MDLELDGNAALCTAATSGLGLASAEALAADGANVAVCGRTPEHVDEARDRLESIGDGDVLAVEADITDPDQIEALVEETVDSFGGLDHVVTSAGGPAPGPFMETTEREWYSAYDLLVMSVVWTTRTAYPYLRDSEAGTIVNITSRSVREVIDDLVLSNAVRRAVIGLMKTQASEFAPEVRVNAVLPGAHETPRIEELVEAAVERGEYDSYEDGIESWADAPLQRVGQPEELGDVVAFLSSARSSYVTGTALPVDGGAMQS
ncbi:SDR family oxidoreductase [Haloarcula argentinensis]|uniref:Oxidoreductase n=1 Tax=Haloarcula argentinensis TaxID=43776 RepID=A0A830FLX4_HALAR|nr:SDR family oxidoreductase [Haloarcula argentinensis]EMA20773.1 glucose dehydrogenase [Haloarcula argentinensis DSM 12282]MDS0255025.1 SDR family oxidoreductase [Haloarcula argentinensis]GGM37196.1 oxidoreductase [Haloarcula argentinensis]